MHHRAAAALLAFLVIPARLPARPPPLEGVPPVIAPPASFFDLVRGDDTRELARAFYKKHLDIKGIPVVAAGTVADQALERTHAIVTTCWRGGRTSSRP